MGQALRFTPGVFYMPTEHSSGKNTIYIRGHNESQIGFYLDGIPINDTYRGQASSFTDLTPFSTFGLSEISVSKGYISPSFGADVLGGAVNMVTTIPTKDLEFAAKYTFISNNENRFDAQVGRNFGDEYFQLTFQSMQRQSLQYSYDYDVDYSSVNAYDMPDTQKKFYVLQGKYGWIINDNHEYSVNFRYQKQKMDAWWNFINYDATTLYVLGNSKFNDFVSLDSRVYYHMNLNATLDSAKYDDYTTGFIESLKFDFSENQNLKVGVNLKHDKHERVDARFPSDTRRLYKTLNSSAFTEYALRINSIFRFTLSASYDRSDGLNIREKKNSREESSASKDRNLHLDGWSLQGILYAQPIEPLLLHANVGRKTNIPNMARLYGGWGSYSDSPDLQPESAMNYELGATFSYASTQVGATGFYNDLTNMMIPVRTDGTRCEAPTTSNGQTYCYQYQNADTGYIYGGEAFVKQGLFNDKLVLGANWSYTQRKSYNYDNYGNRTYTAEFTTHPRQNINFSALIAPRKEYDISFMGSVQTSRYAQTYVTDENGNRLSYTDEHGNTIYVYDYVKIPTVVYFDLVANYYLKENLKLSLGAYNLFDRNYNYTASTTGASSGGLPGRRVFSSVEYRY